MVIGGKIVSGSAKTMVTGDGERKIKKRSDHHEGIEVIILIARYFIR